MPRCPTAGLLVGLPVGLPVGLFVGRLVGLLLVSQPVGLLVGLLVSQPVVLLVGLLLGQPVGLLVGLEGGQLLGLSMMGALTPPGQQTTGSVLDHEQIWGCRRFLISSWAQGQSVS